MTIEQVVRAILNDAGRSSFASLVPGGLWASVIPQRASYPAAALMRVSTQREHAMGVDESPTETHFQLSIYAQNTGAAAAYDTCIAIAAAARVTLSRYRGSGYGLTVQDIFLEGEADLGFDIDTEIYGRHVDFKVWWQEP